MKKTFLKGFIRHIVGGLGGGLVGYGIGAGIEPDTIKNILEWIEYVAGLLLLISASAASALDKVSTEKKTTLKVQLAKEEAKNEKIKYNQ